jgi:hypothetical protein
MQLQIQFGDTGTVQDCHPAGLAKQICPNYDAVIRHFTGAYTGPYNRPYTSPEPVASPTFEIEELAFDHATELPASTDKDNCIKLLTVEQAVHDTGARKACLAYWHGERRDREVEIGQSKFDTCAYLQTESVQIFDSPGMGTELACLTSFLAAAHSKDVIDGYVGTRQTR